MILVYIVMLTILLVISVIDVKEKRISSKGLLILLVGGIAAIVINRDLSMLDGVTAMLIVYIVLWIIHRFSKGSLGLGDVKLCAVIALYLGVERTFGMISTSMILCSITALVLIIVDKGYKNKSLPFAPFVAAGTMMAILL